MGQKPMLATAEFHAWPAYHERFQQTLTAIIAKTFCDASVLRQTPLSYLVNLEIWTTKRCSDLLEEHRMILKSGLILKLRGRSVCSR